MSVRASQAFGTPIGSYRGRPIWGTVILAGTVYRFDRIVPRRHRECIRAGELYIERGLVYGTSAEMLRESS